MNKGKKEVYVYVGIIKLKDFVPLVLHDHFEYAKIVLAHHSSFVRETRL
jgi:hypothetical protein